VDIAKRALEKHASLSLNSRFVFISTRIFYRSEAVRHDVGIHSVLPIDCLDDDLSTAVRASLNASRMIDINSEGYLLSFPETGRKYEEWVAKTVDERGYSSRKVLFKDMMAVDIDQTPEALTLQPLIHEAVVADLDASDAELGIAIRLAMSRCE